MRLFAARRVELMKCAEREREREEYNRLCEAQRKNQCETLKELRHIEAAMYKGTSKEQTHTVSKTHIQKRPKKHCVLVAQSCSTPCDPMDCSPPGSFVRGILQARILEWVAISLSPH